MGIVADSGRAAARLLADEAWAGVARLAVLPADPQTVRAFLAGDESPFAPETLDQIGAAIHDAYRRERAAERLADDPVMKDWNELPEDLQASNQMQAGHIMEKLREIGCTVHPVTDREPALMRFTKREIEIMAEMEHGRWTAERLESGWSWGPERDPEARTSPYLVSWADLPDDIREYDRETVRKIPDFLAAAGLEIRRLE